MTLTLTERRSLFGGDKQCVDENGYCENANPNQEGECAKCMEFYAVCEQCGEIMGEHKCA